MYKRQGLPCRRLCLPETGARRFKTRSLHECKADIQVDVYKRQAQYVWTLTEGGYKRNEPLEIRNYATVALEIANPILKPPEHDTTAPAPRRRGMRSRTNGGIL